MAKISKITPSPNTVYTKKYETFRGVDFSRDASMVDDIHSPDAKNLISDTDGFPEKRVGWRTLKTLDGRINGIYSFDGDTQQCTLIHSGDKMYKYKDGEFTCLIEGIADSRSMGKYFKGKLCILTGNEYLVFDGETCERASGSSAVYAPITHTGREAMQLDRMYLYDSSVFQRWNTSGTFKHANNEDVYPGAVPETVSLNLISGKRRNTFCQEGGGYLLFALDSTIEAGSRVTMRCISTGEEMFSVIYDGSINTQLYRTEDAEKEGVNTNYFNHVPISASNLLVDVKIGNSKYNNCGYVICSPNFNNLTDYYFTPGVDNFSIEFSHKIDGYEEYINKCTVLDVFENRVFFSGNPDFPHTDWYSGVNDPLFVPDINYTEIGMDSSRIMGYLRTGSEQAILKSDGEDATIYMRSYSALSDGSVIFPIKQGTSGIGAIAPHAICSFLDDPLYLTRNGVYAICSQDISNERALNIRSTKINKKLLRENNISDAVMCEWNGYLILCVNGVAYVADAAQKQYPFNKTNTFEYEWYYWTNIPARVLYSNGGELYFGTDDGRICMFNNDLVNSRGELKSEAYSDDGEAIVAEWATNLSSDGSFMQEKTLVKTGSGVLLKSYNRSGVSVIVRTDRDFGREVTERSAGIFNFEDIDFSEFTFNTAPYSVIPFNSKVKKYSAIQIICRNDKPNHAFGIGGIVRRYFLGKTKK
ncbi:MAG: hypothetical protein IJE70_02895 [Oscillospiraceae bacterium]|nr:hypothetical protein [Oscillospiraceae bacterium]